MKTFDEAETYEAFTLLGELEQTSNSRNEKLAVLKKAKKNRVFKQILVWTYNKDVYYTFPQRWRTWHHKHPQKLGKSKMANIFAEFATLLNDLRERKISGNAAQERVNKLFRNVPTVIAPLFEKVMNHDLRCGINRSTIEEIYGKEIWGTGSNGGNLKFPGCQLAQDFKKWDGFTEMLVEPKLDGFRLSAVCSNNIVTFHTRNGHTEPHTTNLKHIAKQLLKLGFTDCMVDGEIIVGNKWNLTPKVKLKNPKPEELKLLKEEAIYHVFDWVPLAKDSNLAKPDMPFHKRRKVIFKRIGKRGTENLRITKQWRIQSEWAMNKVFDHSIRLGYEGIILKDPNAPYVLKRSKAWLKLKPFITIDAKVIGAELGKGKYSKCLGVFVCEKENGSKVKVGSGYSDEQRVEFWKNRKKYIGKWMELIEQDDKSSVAVARFPTFLRWRDKDGKYE